LTLRFSPPRAEARRLLRRQLGIAIGIAGLGAIFEHHAEALGLRAGIVAGLDSVLLVAAAVAFAAAVLTWPTARLATLDLVLDP
jgi:hypothetical protein